MLWAVIFRHLSGASTVTRISVTIGLQVALVSLSVLLFGNTTIFNPMAFFRQPVPTFEIFSVILNADQAIILGAAAVVAVGLAAVLRLTSAGLVLRGVVDSPTTAIRMGTNPQFVTATTWVLSTMLVGLCGVLLAPLIGLQADSYSGFVAISAAGVVLARFTSIEGTFLAALALGVVQGVVTPHLPSTGVLGIGFRPGLPFVVIFGAIVLYSVTGKLREADERPIVAAELRGKRDRRERAAQRLGANRDRGAWDTWLGWVLGAIGLVVIATRLPGFWLGTVASGLAVAIVMVSWKAVTWGSRITSLAQISFAGMGAAAAGLFANNLGVPTAAAVVLGALCAGVLGAVLGVLVLSSGALYAALATFALGLFVDNVVYNVPAINEASTGLPLEAVTVGPFSFADRKTAFFGVLLVFAAVGLLLRAVQHSTAGTALACVRNSPVRARTLGIDVSRYRVASCAVGAMIAGLGGGIFASLQGTTYPENFLSSAGLVWFVVMMSLGLGSTGGALAAGMAITVMPALLNQYTNSTVVEILPILFGLGAIGLTHVPEGHAGQVRSFARSNAVRLELAILWIGQLISPGQRGSPRLAGAVDPVDADHADALGDQPEPTNSEVSTGA
jgi:ABC-type branched-subunit amino acid transport system permease subunit